jgi:hypothetical protein
VTAALACGLIVLVGYELAGSVLAATAAALLFAGSYTYWSQAVIAEVYTLHILLTSAALLLLLRWDRTPTTGRIVAFLAVYALSFGNHLTSILLLPAYATFLLTAPRERWRHGGALRALILGAGFAAAGALQYAWNFRTTWISPVPPEGAGGALALFWFDVTKSDWREVMIMGVHPSVLADRLGMYWFDLRQQFGWPALVVVAAGVLHLSRRNRRAAALLLLVYLVSVFFALGYNVGDAHVFLLPSHLALALFAAPGVLLVGRVLPSNGVASALMIGAVGARVYVDYPALDRSRDGRPQETIDSLARGLHAGSGVLLTQVNWQIQNGLSYYTKAVRPELVHARLADVGLYLPAFVRDNHAINREVVVTAQAKIDIETAYGPLFAVEPDDRVKSPRLDDTVRTLPEGTRYVLTVLRPLEDYPVDRSELAATVGRLTGDARLTDDAGSQRQSPDYFAIAGRVGRSPALAVSADRPFRRSLDLDGIRVQIRMDSWLAFDTIRRMGFGHVVVGRTHALIVERGISLVAFDDSGHVLESAYRSNIFAPEPRFRLRE